MTLARKCRVMQLFSQIDGSTLRFEQKGYQYTYWDLSNLGERRAKLSSNAINCLSLVLELSVKLCNLLDDNPPEPGSQVAIVNNGLHSLIGKQCVM